MDCVICSSGKYSGIKSQSCTNCEVGRYLSDDVQNEGNHDSILDCIICGKAKYAHQEGMQACVNCIAGTYLEDDGKDVTLHDQQSDCKVCNSGQHSGVGSHICTECISGTYLGDAGVNAAAHDNINKCLICPSGKISSVGSQACSDCPSGRKEFIDDNKRGYIFKTNDMKSLIEVYKIFFKDDQLNLKKKLIEAKKEVKNFTQFRYHLNLKNILDN